jgi:hypothetical protein
LATSGDEALFESLLTVPQFCRNVKHREEQRRHAVSLLEIRADGVAQQRVTLDVRVLQKPEIAWRNFVACRKPAGDMPVGFNREIAQLELPVALTESEIDKVKPAVGKIEVSEIFEHPHRYLVVACLVQIHRLLVILRKHHRVLTHRNIVFSKRVVEQPVDVASACRRSRKQRTKENASHHLQHRNPTSFDFKPTPPSEDR